MKLIFCRMIVVFCACTVAESADCQTETESDAKFTLDGVWQSDWKRTEQHIKKDCKTTPEQIALYRNLMGKMTVTYEDDRVTTSMPAIRFQSGGEERVLEGWTTTKKLDVLGRTTNQIVVLNDGASEHFKTYVQVINFIDEDTFWLYLGHSPLSGGHIREYFKRVPRETPKK